MKKVISTLMCVVLLFACIYIPSSATGEKAKTVFYLNYGDVSIDEYIACGYDENGKYVATANSLGYVITQKNPNTEIDRGITVSSVKCDIELKNLNISRFNEYDCAFALKKSANVTVTLTGENHLVSGTYRAGLEIGIGSTAVINGDGALYAQSSLQAGIGGGNGQSNGTLIIDSGTIYATGGINGYSAGIGGGTNGNGGNITINGGFVYAQGGLYGAGIGGGFMCGGGNITINGGVVTAIGGDGGAGIGSGYIASGTTNIEINGGSVKAIAGMYGENIGNGYKASTAFSGIHNSDCNVVSLKNVTVENFNELYINGIETYPITKLHPDDNRLYLYSDSSNKIVTAYMKNGSVEFFKVNNTGASQVNPYSGKSERFEDKLITDNIETISVSDGFIVNDNTDLFFNGVLVDYFEPLLRGDPTLDGRQNGEDAVIVNFIIADMLSEPLTVKLSDVDANGVVDETDFSMLFQYGLEGK